MPEFCLAMRISGAGALQTHAHRQTLEAGDAFLLRPGEWHRHRPSSASGWELMWIHFNGNDPLKWLRDNVFRLRGNIPEIGNRELFRAQFEHLLEWVHRDPSVNSPNHSRQAIGLLSHFLSDPPANPPEKETGIDDETVKMAVEFIWNFSHGIVDVPAVARYVDLPRRTLDRKFRTATGQTILQEIQRCRVTRAVQLLEETDMPIKHVVHRAGFRSAEHLRITFQKAFGKSPEAYRNSSGHPLV